MEKVPASRCQARDRAPPDPAHNRGQAGIDEQLAVCRPGHVASHESREMGNPEGAPGGQAVGGQSDGASDEWNACKYGHEAGGGNQGGA